jgi:AhpD family alkylhydroperoxidase
MEKQTERRLVDTPTFYGYLEDVITNLGHMRAAVKSGRVSKAFSERIMLAVTQVNGCRYCSHYHTKLALESGMSNAEIENLLNGELGNVPQEELVALMYAQHYAETGGRPDPKVTQRLVGTYGAAMSRDILAYIRAITVGNFYGNAFDAFQQRLRREPVPDSTLRSEMGILFGSIAYAPAIAIRQVVKRISK